MPSCISSVIKPESSSSSDASFIPVSIPLLAWLRISLSLSSDAPLLCAFKTAVLTKPKTFFATSSKSNKDSTLLAFGGGTIGDLGGFAASIYYRGLNLTLMRHYDIITLWLLL